MNPSELSDQRIAIDFWYEKYPGMHKGELRQKQLDNARHAIAEKLVLEHLVTEKSETLVKTTIHSLVNKKPWALF